MRSDSEVLHFTDAQCVTVCHLLCVTQYVQTTTNNLSFLPSRGAVVALLWI